MKKIFLKVIKWIWMSILAFAAYELIIGALLFTYITRAGNYYGIADMDIELSSLYRDHYIMDSLEAQRYHEKSDKQSADSMMILAIEYREKSERYINVHMPDDRKTAEDAEKFVKTLFKLDIINIWGPTTLTPDDLKRRFPDDFDKLDLDEINRRRTILMDRGYTDFTWYHNTYKQACKVYRDYEFQGDGWQVYCCTGHNVHLMTNEQFQAELDALPGKERVAEEDHKRWIAKEKEKKIKKSNSKFLDHKNLECIISSIDLVINESDEFETDQYKLVFDKFKFEFNKLKEIVKGLKPVS